MTDNDRGAMGRSDDDLIAAFLAGEVAAARELFTRHAGGVFRYALAWLGRAQDAEDVLQEAFAQAFARLGQYRGPGRFKPWLLAICRHRIQNDRRRAGVVEALVDPQREDLGPAAPGTTEAYERVLDGESPLPLLAGLPARAREVLLLHFVEHLSYPEMAELMGQSEANLRQIVSRSLARLRKEVGGDVLCQVR